MILVELFPPDELLKFAIFMWSLIIGSAFGFLFLLSKYLHDLSIRDLRLALEKEDAIKNMTATRVWHEGG